MTRKEDNERERGRSEGKWTVTRKEDNEGWGKWEGRRRRKMRRERRT